MTNVYDRAIDLGTQADSAKTVETRIQLYRQAWLAVPEPRFDWDLATWIWNSLCSSYIEKRDFAAALDAARTAEKCYRGQEDSRTAYQIGVVLLEGYADESGAATYFKKASDLSDGRELRSAPTRYRSLAKNVAKWGDSYAQKLAPAVPESESSQLTLSAAVSTRIEELSEEGNRLLEAGHNTAAIEVFSSALQLLPLPREGWEAFTWIHSAIGDAHFNEGDWSRAVDNFRSARCGPQGMENPFIHLRLGQSAFELGQMSWAVDELLQAYMLEGEDIFAEDPKYFEFLRASVNL